MNKSANAVITACVVFSLLLTLFSFAAAETGSGEQFAFVSSSAVNGSTSVDPAADITLKFNRDVVNSKVKNNNEKCFTLTDSAGKAVDFKAEMDGATDEEKMIIRINPDEPLKYSTKYTLTVSKNLKAEDGSFLSDNSQVKDDIKITFTTKADPSATTAPTTSTTAASTASTTAASTGVSTTRHERTRKSTTARATTKAQPKATTAKPATTKAVVPATTAALPLTTAQRYTAPTVPATAPVTVPVPATVPAYASQAIPVTGIIPQTTQYVYYTMTGAYVPVTADSDVEKEPEHKVPAVLAAVAASAAVAAVCGVAIVKKESE